MDMLTDGDESITWTDFEANYWRLATDDACGESMDISLTFGSLEGRWPR